MTKISKVIKMFQEANINTFEINKKLKKITVKKLKISI